MGEHKVSARNGKNWLRDRCIHIESMHRLPEGCMHVKSSLTSAYAKLGLSRTKNNICVYMTIELSQLMLNLYVVIHAWPFSRHAIDKHPLCE